MGYIFGQSHLFKILFHFEFILVKLCLNLCSLKVRASGMKLAMKISWYSSKEEKIVSYRMQTFQTLFYFDWLYSSNWNLYGPFTQETWLTPCLEDPLSQPDPESIEFAVNQVKRHNVSKTAQDCSIMVAMQQISPNTSR